MNLMDIDEFFDGENSTAKGQNDPFRITNDQSDAYVSTELKFKYCSSEADVLEMKALLEEWKLSCLEPYFERKLFLILCKSGYLEK